jgi:hypothetical protein
MARRIRKQIRTTRGTRRNRSAAVLGALVALLVVTAAPAFAHHKADHDHGGATSAPASDHDGDADSDESTAYTEDSDGNDGGTPDDVADEGDNAHPSGKDRSVESGGSGTQGKSESNPDDGKGPMRHEGAVGDDKANGPGGTDLADQDGNNGCGNDDDFNDDNNGWCGKKTIEVDEVVSGATTEGCPAGTDMAGLEADECNEDEVHGRIDRALPKAIERAEVLGSVINQASPTVTGARVQGAVLPFTGGNVLGFLAAGFSLIALGTLTLRRSTLN